MLKRSKAEARRNLLVCLVLLGLVAAVMAVPYKYWTKAADQKSGGKGQGLIQKTVSHEEEIPNYDIREEKSSETGDALVSYRQASGKDASAVANVRDGFVRGENELRERVPTLKIEYNTDIRIPEVIGPDVERGRAFLTSATRPAGRKHADVLINFLKQNNSLVGATNQQIDALKVFADYTNPDGNLSWVELEQHIHGIPVFRGGVKAGFTKTGELIRVINNLAPGLDYDTVSADFGDASAAVRYAAPLANYDLKAGDTTPNSDASSNDKVRFGAGGDWDITAEKMYFPTEPGVAVPAWRVLIWKPVNAYYIIVDARTGTMLWRKNLAEDQTQPATYNVYATGSNLVGALDSPQPITPGPLDPTLGTQGIFQNRSDVTLIGNEAPNPGQNNLGWMTDGSNGVNGWTDGNNIQAGLDIDGTNGVDASQAGVNRVFSFAYNPPPGNPTPGDVPATATLRSGASTNLFYLNNRYHDVLYSVGFNEAARNFQNDNFGRGGVAGDRVSGEAQDSSGTNNANFATGSDGVRGRMQMYIFTNTPVNRDGDFDADVVFHEHSHGLSNRLIGNGGGLTTTRSRGMGEGWGDFIGSVLLSEPSDPVNGIYTTGSYDTFQVAAFGIGANNGYYGIRRLPYAPIGFRGGAQNRPHNPLTAIDAIPGCTINDGAFAPIGGGACDEVHNGGEVWASMLFEVRAQLINRLGQAPGNFKMLQFVVSGMKLSPVNPTFQQERDSLISAAQASSAAPEAAVDVADVWTGMALRGMGFGATDDGTTIVQSFFAPGAISIDPFSVSDSSGDNDGYPEPGESVLLNIAVTNTTGATINGVTVNVNGGNSLIYGDIANGQTVTNNVPYTIPANTTCGSLHQVSINVVNPTGTNTTVRSFRLGAPTVAPLTFSNSAAITIPSGAPATTNGPSTPYPSTIAVSGLTGNKIVKVKLNQLSHTSPNNIDILLVGPGGQKMEILSDQGGANSVSNIDLTLADAPVTGVGATLVTGEFKPTADAGQDAFVSPAPGPTYLLAAPGGTATLASAYGSNGATMNGNWNLFIVDDTATNVGSVAGGWSLIFESADFTCVLGGSSPTPTNTPTTGPTATATGTPPVTVALPTVSASPGASITIPVTAGDTTGRGIISYDLNIDFDPAVVVPANPAFDAVGTLSSAMSITPNSTSAGHLIISAFQAQNLAGAGTLLNLKFTVVGTVGSTTPLTFADYTDPGQIFHPGFAWNEGDPPAFTTNGRVTVSGGATSTNTPTNTATATSTPTRTSTSTPTATATSTPICGPAAWSSGPVQVPARYAIQGVLGTDNQLYIAGGQSADATPVVYNQVSRFNPATNTWSNVAPLPVALGQGTSGAWNGKIYVAGGFTGGTTVTNALRIYDIATNTWTSGANMPTAVEAAAGVVVNGKFYVMGGDDFNNGVNTNYIYDIATNAWSTGAVVPDARTNTYGTAVNGLIYVYGGVNIVGGNFVTTDTLLRYNPATNVWTNLGSAGTAGLRGNYGAVSAFGTNQLLITDGANAAGVSTNATHIFNIGTGTFSAGPAMIGSRAGHAQGTLPDGRVIVVDGFDTAGTTTSNVELLSTGNCASATPTATSTVGPTNTSTSTPTATATATATGTPVGQVFTNPAAFCTTLGGAADLYPSNITVTGGPSQINTVRVTLFNVVHQLPDNMDFLLVGPQGQKFILMADAGGSLPQATPGVTLTFDDNAGQVLPDSAVLTTGTFEPTSWEPGQASFPAPAPAAPYNQPGSTVGGTGTQTLFGNFGGTNSNGTWSLYLRDDAGLLSRPAAITGCVNGGWQLQFLNSTAASAGISGRVVTANGQGIRNAKVVITGGSLEQPLVVTTGSFGYYSAEGLQAGQTYIVTVISNRYSFSNPTRVISLVDNIVDADFVADPQ